MFLSESFRFANLSWKLCFGQHGRQKKSDPGDCIVANSGGSHDDDDDDDSLCYGFLIVLMDNVDDDCKVEMEATFKLFSATGGDSIERKRNQPFLFGRHRIRQRGIYRSACPFGYFPLPYSSH